MATVAVKDISAFDAIKEVEIRFLYTGAQCTGCTNMCSGWAGGCYTTCTGCGDGCSGNCGSTCSGVCSGYTGSCYGGST